MTTLVQRFTFSSRSFRPDVNFSSCSAISGCSFEQICFQCFCCTSLRPTAFDSVTCDSFEDRYVQQLSIPLRATAFKFATSNSFRFRYVRQLSGSLRLTAFDSITCDSFRFRYVQQLSISLPATGFRFATSNSFRFFFVLLSISYIYIIDTPLKGLFSDKL